MSHPLFSMSHCLYFCLRSDIEMMRVSKLELMIKCQSGSSPHGDLPEKH
jgi:hypothetical protein